MSSLNLNRKSFLLLIAVIASLMLTQSGVFGQGRSRVVRSPSCPYLDDSVLVEISSLSVGDRKVSFDEPFLAGDDWLARLKFRIVNRGSKPIAAIVMTVGLLEGVDETLPTYASFDYGIQFIRINKVKAKRGQAKLADLVRPGEEIEITAEGSKPYGLRYMDAMLGGATRAKNWTEFVATAGVRFHRMEVMGPTIWFTDGSEGSAELLVRGRCDGKKQR